MNIKDLVPQKIEDSVRLNEGVNDPHIFKAIFTLGGPGSGKTTLANKLVAGSGLRPVNVDQFYEMLMGQIAGGYDDELYQHAGTKMMKRLELLAHERLGLLIDGTGRNLKYITGIKEQLEKLGYQTMAIFVDTDLETALLRNQMRKRKVNPDAVKDMHAAVRKNEDDLKKIFGKNLVVVNNTTSLPNLHNTSKTVTNFLNAPVDNPQAKKWVNQQKTRTA